MAYTHFRYIAYEVPTAVKKANNTIVSGFAAGDECKPVDKITVPDLTNADARIRLKRLANAVSKAKFRCEFFLDDNPSTLKIFVAPEFYFRPPSALGLDYINNTYPGTVAGKIFQALGTMFTDTTFSDWLIVPGTIMWNTGEDIKAGKVIYYNSSFQIKGGPVTRSGENLNYIEKINPSFIDGVLDDKGVPYGPAIDPTIKQDYENWQSRKYRVFNDGNVRCGLEICRDHLYGIANNTLYDLRVLKHVLDDWTRNEGRDPEPINLHLLIAAGMTIVNASVAAKVGGYILRNDGYFDSSFNYPHSELKQITSYTCINPGLRTAWDQDLTPWDPLGEAVMDPTVAAESTVTFNGAEKVPMDDTYDTLPQRLVIYPPKALV